MMYLMNINTDAREKHRQNHVKLHDSLMELVADYQQHNGGGMTLADMLSRHSIGTLVAWSSTQTFDPTPLSQRENAKTPPADDSIHNEKT